MSDHGRKPIRWANDLNIILAKVFGEGRFPVPVEDVAAEYSRNKFPTEPVVEIKGRALGSFEGALYRVREGKGWAIIYNSGVSEGRQRFTIAHELGHYLMHRSLLPPEGLECSEESVTFRDGEDMEKEADTFAAYLLMPFDDFRRQLPADKAPSLDELSTLAERYGVSLISCVIRWLEYTERRSMIVVSRDGFILWSKSSKPALMSRLYYRTRQASPIETPQNSLVARRDFAVTARDGIQHPVGVWFGEECTEITVHSDKYDQVITILHFGRAPPRDFHGEVDEPDTFDAFDRSKRNRFGDT
jgi:Zn-dependent peptidase ImmA (M78 family)